MQKIYAQFRSEGPPPHSMTNSFVTQQFKRDLYKNQNQQKNVYKYHGKNGKIIIRCGLKNC